MVPAAIENSLEKDGGHVEACAEVNNLVDFFLLAQKLQAFLNILT